MSKVEAKGAKAPAPEPPKEDSPCKKMVKRFIIGHTFQAGLYSLYHIPLLWMTANLLMPAASMWEFGTCVRGILNKVGLGYLKAENWKSHGNEKIQDWRHISMQLIERVTVRHMSVALLVAFHITFLTMRSKNINTCFVMGYIFILFYKI